MDIAMVYRGDGPHPSHRGFAESIDADLVGLDRFGWKNSLWNDSIPGEILNGVALPEYDIYIAEGTRPLYGCIANQMTRKNSSKLVYLAADHSIYKLTENSYPLASRFNRIIRRFGIGLMERVFNRYIDGVIAVSELVKNHTERILDNKPTKIAPPYIQPGVHSELEQVEPYLNRNIAITVGSYGTYKGQDMLCDAWKDVREEVPNAELKLVGEGYPEEFSNIPGVEVLGYVENLASVVKSSSLYIQASRVDAFGVAVLEGMCAGLPPVVTRTSGVYPEVEKIEEDLVTGPSPESLAESVVNYFRKPMAERLHLSEKAFRAGSQFDSESSKENFQEKFQELILEIDEGFEI